MQCECIEVRGEIVTTNFFASPDLSIWSPAVTVCTDCCSTVYWSIVKVQLTLCTPRRRVAKMEVSLRSFLSWALDVVRDKLHVRPLYPVPNNRRLVWTFRRRDTVYLLPLQ